MQNFIRSPSFYITALLFATLLALLFVFMRLEKLEKTLIQLTQSVAQGDLPQIPIGEEGRVLRVVPYVYTELEQLKKTVSELQQTNNTSTKP